MFEFLVVIPILAGMAFLGVMLVAFSDWQGWSNLYWPGVARCVVYLTAAVFGIFMLCVVIASFFRGI